MQFCLCGRRRNAIGAFYEFIEDTGVRLIGCEAAGLGIDTPQNAATIATGAVGVFHGMKSYFVRMKTARLRLSIPYRQVLIIRGSGRSTPCSMIPAGLNIMPLPMRKPFRPLNTSPIQRASFLPLKAPTPLPVR